MKINEKVRESEKPLITVSCIPFRFKFHDHLKKNLDPQNYFRIQECSYIMF